MNKIMLHYPNLHFHPEQRFIWSPSRQTIFYNQTESSSNSGKLALLHEIGHAELGHEDYTSDVKLLKMELDAWAYARQNARQFGVSVDEEHIDSCLEGYRIWLHKRSLCPDCQFHGLQTERTSYRCFMCRRVWRVARTLTLQPHRLQCRQ